MIKLTVMLAMHESKLLFKRFRTELSLQAIHWSTYLTKVWSL